MPNFYAQNAMLKLTLRHQRPIPNSLHNCSPTLARILAARGVASTDELIMDSKKLLPADDLLGMGLAVARIDSAIDNQEKILIVGDFDCDGATSTALMMRVLRQMGAVVDFLVPDRFVFGYGLTPKLVQHAYNAHTPQLIITVDNGISSHEGVTLANNLNIDVVITDHHLASDDNPEAVAVVNPNQKHCSFASKSLVGVGVAFYVMGALAKHRRLAGKTSVQVSQYLDLVALGTVADIGKLDHNNRILVAYGLQIIKSGSGCLGILALLNQAKKQPDALISADLGFLVAPRINAAGRMDNMKIGIECLLTDNPHTAQELAYQLNKLNIERRMVENQMRQNADDMLEVMNLKAMNLDADNPKKAVILYNDTWHQGVIGIVAGRIKDKCYLPTLIFAPNDTQKLGDDDLIKASARSIDGVHIRDVLVAIDQKYPDLICYFGGHSMAAGLSIYKKDFERFCAAFYEQMQNFDESVFCQTKFTDGQLSPEEISLGFANYLDNLTVWGQGFAYPSFDGVFAVLSFKILKEKHLKITLKHPDLLYPTDAIWFNYDKDKWHYTAQSVHILYKLNVNEYQGNQSVQFVIEDLAVL